MNQKVKIYLTIRTSMNIVNTEKLKILKYCSSYYRPIKTNSQVNSRVRNNVDTVYISLHFTVFSEMACGTCLYFYPYIQALTFKCNFFVLNEIIIYLSIYNKDERSTATENLI